MKDKSILITGGFGHIGSQLAKYLCHDNRVTIIDNGLMDTTSDTISELPLEIYNMDVNQIDKFENKFDIVYHLGEYSRVEQSLSEPELVLNNNFCGIMSALKLCVKSNAKLVYSGSSTKFADGGAAGYTNPYAFSKKVNTEIVEYYCNSCSVDYAIVYFNNVYGPGECGTGKYATVIEKFLQQVSRNEELTVRLPGDQERIFTHIDDTIDALVRVGMFGAGDGYIICSDEAYAIISLAKLISNRINYLPPTSANRQQGLLDNRKMKSLGWRPRVDLKEYIIERLKNIGASK
jgi:UDP-glucose 4-epimerase